MLSSFSSLRKLLSSPGFNACKSTKPPDSLASPRADLSIVTLPQEGSSIPRTSDTLPEVVRRGEEAVMALLQGYSQDAMLLIEVA